MLHVRDAIAGDYDAYARLFLELGVDEGTPSRERFTSELAARIVVALDSDDVVGYALLEQLDGVGYVRNIVSDPARRRSGIGVALMESARERFKRASATTWVLNVKADNRAAIGLYEKLGMGLHYRTTVMRLPRETALPPADPSLTLDRIPPDSDPVVEPAFHLLPGQLASARKKPGRMVVQLARTNEVLGVGVFMPVIPGSFPFRLATPEHAATFITLLREHAPASAPWLQIGAEDHAALAAHLQELGAYVHLELLHMHGPLA